MSDDQTESQRQPSTDSPFASPTRHGLHVHDTIPIVNATRHTEHFLAKRPTPRPEHVWCG